MINGYNLSRHAALSTYRQVVTHCIGTATPRIGYVNVNASSSLSPTSINEGEVVQPIVRRYTSSSSSSTATTTTKTSSNFKEEVNKARRTKRETSSGNKDDNSESKNKEKGSTGTSCCANVQQSLENKHSECFKKIVHSDDEYIARDDSPIQVAILMNDKDMLKQLLANPKDNDVNFANKVGFTALHYCAMAMMMQQKGARPSPKMTEQEQVANDSLEVVDMLIKAGADVHIKTPTQTDAFGIAASMRMLPLCRRLLEAGANPNNVNEEGDSPLMSAISNQDVPLVDFLVNEAKADIGYVNPRGDETAYQRAGFYTYIPVLKVLIKAGAKDKDRTNTALHYTVASNKIQSTRLLLAHQPEAVNFRDVGGTSPIFLAAQSNFSAMMHLLLEHGARVDYMVEQTNDTLAHVLAFSGTVSDMELITSKGVDINALNILGETALHIAATSGNKDMIDYLVKKRGLDVNLKSVDGSTPLLIAVKQHKLSTARQLLELGASPNIGDEEFRFPIHEAAHIGLPKMVMLLLEYDADTKVVTKGGMTALDLSIEKKNKSCSALLLPK
ncbi:hypothetical protein SAMD00019534_010450 [Acytostelium subglobosum LB1]|uniref:hypothetical protein n=1 Tax=Acytostelium subglobosum LB1 TaxID=1410327 RepID=UPI0006450294|nr:hypothetical protein SAMD00019534_010450 [Acytostelium subglobosum LB1]GAM17870.1 hypothetical protein SAMD00019534_010450 [Acytostelium subglobosum LB1]|eukprot:XP_012758466.1 hypothetical protein SAMD00019534_010450 [Acytostelium subglobosum LB1]